MGINSAEEVGRIIAGLVKANEQVKEDHVPSEILQSLILSPVSRLKLTTSVVVTKNYHDGSSLILDHPVYGQLDNSTLLTDGGYSSTVTHDDYSG